MPWIVGGAILGGSVLGAVASDRAAGKQAGAAGDASRVQQNMFDTTQQNLSPYMQTGTASLSQLGNLLGIPDAQSGPNWQEYLRLNPDVAAGPFANNPQQHYEQYGKKEGRNLPQIQAHGQDANFGSLAKPFSLSDFQASPAYNFNLEQGMNAINKGAAAKGNLYAPQTLQDLGKFAQGTASNEYQNAFSNYNTNQNNLFGRLQTLSGGGQNAAANLGGFAAQTAGQIGGNMMGAGNANAAGIVGGANAISGGIGDYYNYQLMQQILKQQQTPTYGVNAGAGGGSVFGGS